MTNKAGETYIAYLQAFDVDAREWTYARAYRLYNYFRQGDGGSPDPQPATNIFAKTYHQMYDRWMDKEVKVRGSEKPTLKEGIRGKVIEVSPRQSTTRLRN